MSPLCRHLLTTLASVAALMGCQPNKAPPMTPDEAQHVAQLTERMSSRCVGRYLIDVPASFVLNSHWSAEIDDVSVDVQPMTKAVFDQSLNAYRRKLESTKLPLNGLPYLSAVVSIERGVVFDRANSDASTGRASRQLEAWGWNNGFKLSATVAAFDGTFPEDADSKFHREQGSNIPQKLRELKSVFHRLRGRPETEVPQEPGFCIANGFVAGPASENEQSYVSFQLDRSPDVWFNMANIQETGKEDSRLLERAAKTEREMQASDTQTIRKGVVTLGGAPFDEWLFKGPTPDRVPGTMFYLMGNEARPGLAHPFIRVQLFNGFRIPAPERTGEESALLKDLERATLSEAEAVGVWDRIVPTVRLRPGAF